MNKLNQQGIAHILAILSLLLIVAGVAVTVFLVGKQQVLKSRANINETRIQIVDRSTGQPFANDTATTRSVKLSATYVAPAASSPSQAPAQTTAAQPAQGTESISFAVNTGWNLIAWPFGERYTAGLFLISINSNPNVGNVCDQIRMKEGDPKIGPNGERTASDPDQGTVLQKESYLMPGHSYFIRCNKAHTFSATNPIFKETADQLFQRLSTGEQWISFAKGMQWPAGSNVTASSLLSVIDAKAGLSYTCDFLAAWDVANQTWRVYHKTESSKGATGTVSDLNITASDPTVGYSLACKPRSQAVQGVSTAYAQTVFPSQIRVSNDQNAISSAQEFTFSGNPTTIDWELTEGNGQKTVYAQFKVNGTYEGQPVVSATINLQVGGGTSQTTGTQTGSPRPQESIQFAVVTGWNWIGWPFEESKRVSDLLTIIEGAHGRCSRVETRQGNSPGSPATVLGPNDSLSKGKGYTIQCSQPATFYILGTPFTETWKELQGRFGDGEWYASFPKGISLAATSQSRAESVTAYTFMRDINFNPNINYRCSSISVWDPSNQRPDIYTDDLRKEFGGWAGLGRNFNITASDPTVAYGIACRAMSGGASATSQPSSAPRTAQFTCTACAADIAGGSGGNPDGVVSILDYSLLQSCFNKTQVKNQADWGRCSKADINGDKAVTVMDFSCLTSKFNQQCPEHKR